MGLGKMRFFPAKTAALCLIMYVVMFTVQMGPATAQGFRCTTSGATCNSIIDYPSPNTTTLGAIRTLFGIKNLRTLLGANGLPPSTPQNFTVTARQIIKIPFPCFCRNNTGISNRKPIYSIAPGDGLYHIAAEVFGGLMKYPDIQSVNNISDAELTKLEIGRKLWIPLPCSCDPIDGQQVVHYGHMVAPGSTVSGIAQQYNTTESTLLALNGLNNSSDLKANVIFDVPLKVCTSRISNDSLDNPLLVPNGTYVYTATNCIRCQCDAANNWILQCQPSGMNSSVWQSCPSVQCQGGLSLGSNTTISNCVRTSCAYAGYNNQTILAALDQESICPASSNKGVRKFGLQGWSWNFFVMVILLVGHILH